jgi:holo-[acyl-carrier-protein] synthase
MVLGMGSDLIEIKRIAESIERYGERFLQRVFTDDEIAFCRRKWFMQPKASLPALPRKKRRPKHWAQESAEG